MTIALPLQLEEKGANLICGSGMFTLWTEGIAAVIGVIMGQESDL